MQYEWDLGHCHHCGLIDAGSRMVTLPDGTKVQASWCHHCHHARRYDTGERGIIDDAGKWTPVE